MPSTTGNVAMPAQRLPAWKRLGLKLKSASGVENTEESLPKRKQSPTASEPLSKRVKTIPTISTNTAASILKTPTLARKKSVSFTPETKIDDGDSIKQLFNSWVADQKKQDPSFEFKSTNTNTALRTVEAPSIVEQVDPTLNEKERRLKRTKKVKAGNIPKGEQKTYAATTRPFLQYLQQYHNSRATWKFNKNHQNHLLKHALDVSIIPSDHVHLLYAYVRGLQGGVRTRLRDTALAAKVEDQEAGPAGFPANMANKNQRQIDYEAAIKEYIATMTAANVDQEEIGYEEGVLLGLSDKGMMKRAARRMRTEKILKELEATGTSITDEKAHHDVDRPVDGAPKKIVRKRKQRTAVEDDTSSSESSDSDSSDSSSEEGGDSEIEGGDGSSSSSNSSSSSDSDSSSVSSEKSDSD